MPVNEVEVRYGLADRSHENEFFRYFAKSVKAYFDKKGIPAVLLGMPTCLVNSKLQIDALLITSKTITIIDFKNYSGELILPDEDSFRTSEWRTESNVVIQGGSSRNPFCQIGLQRERLSQILKTFCKNRSKLDPNHVSTIVCFSQPMKVLGHIPGRYRTYFNIADSDDFLEKLFDTVSAGREDEGLLDSKFIDYFNEKVFSSDEYDLTIDPASLGIVREDTKQAESLDVQEKIEKEVNDYGDFFTSFFESDANVLLVTGTIGSGKTGLAPLIRSCALSSGFTSAKVLALSNRVKRNLLGSMEDIDSLYSTLYDFTQSQVEENGKQFIPIAKLEQLEAFGDLEDDKLEEQRSVFIVYESQMVTNSLRTDDQIQYGSGKLLDDLFKHLEIEGPSSKNKVVFVGDKFQLGFGSWTESSLNPGWYSGKYTVEQLDLPDTDNPTGIQAVCIDIANAIRLNRTCQLVISPNEQVRICESSNERQVLERVFENWQKSKVLSYMNRQASGLNKYMKTHFAGTGNCCGIGDVILFDNQVLAYPVASNNVGVVHQFEDQIPRRIENGEFGTIVSIGDKSKELTFTEQVSGEDEPIKLTLANAQVRLASSTIGEVVDIYYIKELLESNEAKLSLLQETALQIHMKNLMESFLLLHPFEQSVHFQEMRDSGDYRLNKNDEYRDKEDARYLTVYEKRHRKEVQAMLLQSDTEYSRWLNAARIKYGWCMTVHKAMSATFDEVVFSTNYGEQGRDNETYFKFVYTGISRARNRANLVRWKPVSPFADADFGPATNASGTGKKKAYILQSGEGKTKDDIEALLKNALPSDLEVCHVKSAAYLELFEISRNDELVKVAFDYGKDFQVKPPRFATGDKILFEDICRAMPQSNESAEAISAIGWIYDYLNTYALSDIALKVLNSTSYRDMVLLELDGASSRVCVDHTKEGSISHFNLAAGDDGLYEKAVSQIKRFYELENL